MDANCRIVDTHNSLTLTLDVDVLASSRRIAGWVDVVLCLPSIRQIPGCPVLASVEKIRPATHTGGRPWPAGRSDVLSEPASTAETQAYQSQSQESQCGGLWRGDRVGDDFFNLCIEEVVDKIGSIDSPDIE